MLKKYLLTLFLFSAPLFSMGFRDLDTQELKHTLEQLNRTHIVLECLAKRVTSDSQLNPEARSHFLQQAMQANMNLLQWWADNITICRAALAERSDQ